MGALYLLMTAIGVPLLLWFAFAGDVDGEGFGDADGDGPLAVIPLSSVAFVMAFFSWLVTLPTFIQEEWGWSVVRTGFAIAPTPLLAMLLSPLLGRLADEIGIKPIVVVGGAAGTIGALLHRLLTDSDANYVTGILLPGLFIGVAAGASFAMLVAASMRDIAPSQFGMAGAGRTTIFQLGVAAGVALGFAITVGEGSSADALARIHTLWVACAVLYFTQFLVFSIAFPSEPEATEPTPVTRAI